MTTLRRRWGATVAATSMLLLAGCAGGDGDDPPTAAETTASQKSPSEESPSQEVTTEETTPAAEPPDMEEPTPKPTVRNDDVNGAAATALYFLQIYDYMRATGSTVLWDSVVAPDCGWCANQRETAVKIHDEGWWVESPGLDFDINSSGVSLPTGDVPYYTVIFEVVAPPFEIVSTDGVLRTVEGTTIDPIAVGVQWIDGRFQVVGVNYEPA